MLYRIDRIDSEGEKSYEYVLGKRALGKWCFENYVHNDMEIERINKICFSWKALKVCAKHTISKEKNRTVD